MNRVALDLGFIQIYWYSICIVVGMLVGMYFVFKEAKRLRVSEDFMTSLIINTILVGIIGARLYYVIFNFDYYSKHILEIFEIWNGGLAIHGGIILGTLYLLYFTKRRYMGTLKIMDICCIGLIIGQTIGRWGNFFNGEAYGPAVSRTVLESMHLPKFIIQGMNINGVYYLPTFLYESVWNLIGFGMLLFFRKFKYLKLGQLTGFYLMWYSLGRFFIESFRTDSLMIGDFRAAQIVSFVMFALGFFFVCFRMKTARFDFLYNPKED